MNDDGTAGKLVSGSDNTDGFALSPKGESVIYGREGYLWLASLKSGYEEQLTCGDNSESKPSWLASGDVLYHHKVGSITSLRVLVHAEPGDIPGLATPAREKLREQRATL